MNRALSRATFSTSVGLALFVANFVINFDDAWRGIQWCETIFAGCIDCYSYLYEVLRSGKRQFLFFWGCQAREILAGIHITRESQSVQNI